MRYARHLGKANRCDHNKPLGIILKINSALKQQQHALFLFYEMCEASLQSTQVQRQRTGTSHTHREWCFEKANSPMVFITSMRIPCVVACNSLWPMCSPLPTIPPPTSSEGLTAAGLYDDDAAEVDAMTIHNKTNNLRNAETDELNLNAWLWLLTDVFRGESMQSPLSHRFYAGKELL